MESWGMGFIPDMEYGPVSITTGSGTELPSLTNS